MKRSSPSASWFRCPQVGAIHALRIASRGSFFTGLLMLVALAQPAVLNAQFTFTTNLGAITITKYTGTNNAAIIPAATNGYPVTGISSEAFSNCPTLISVTVPASIKSYGNSTFHNCTNLLAFYFQGNSPPNYSAGGGIVVLQNVPNATAYYLLGATGWLSAWDFIPAVQWNPQVVADLVCANRGGQLEVTGYTGSNGLVVLPAAIDGVRVSSIASNAFANCASLTNIVIAKPVTNLEYAAFQNCSNLVGTYFLGKAPTAGAAVFDGAANVTNYYLPNTTGWGGTFASRPAVPVPFAYRNDNGALTITGYSGSGGAVTVFSTINGLPVTAIGANSLRQINATSIMVADGIDRIEDGAFGNCLQLTSVSIPASVTNIGAKILYACTKLATITVDPLSEYFSSADGVLFDRSQTKLIKCPEKKSGSYTIPDAVTVIGDQAFAYCSALTAVTIPNAVTAIGTEAFDSCTGLTGLVVPDTVTQLGARAFSTCLALGDVNIPSGITAIPSGLFLHCGITNVAMPEGVTAIGSFAFYGCTSLTNITIPDSVTSIDVLAFEDCSALIGVYFRGDAPAVGSSVFDGDMNAVAYYLPGTVGWGPLFANRPTALWLPRIQPSDARFGIPTGPFGFQVEWADGRLVVIEACTDSLNAGWSPLRTNVIPGGVAVFSDSDWANHSARLYRVRAP